MQYDESDRGTVYTYEKSIAIMRHSAALAVLCRIAVFAANAAVAHFEERPDIAAVVYHSALQVCVVGVVYLCWIVGRSILLVVRRDRYMHVATALNTVGEAAGSDGAAVDEKVLTASEEGSAEDTSAQIVFADAHALRTYVTSVHCIGILMWLAVIALDFSHPYACLCFTCGLWLVDFMHDVGTGMESERGCAHRVGFLLVHVAITGPLLAITAVWTPWPMQYMQKVPLMAVVNVGTLFLTGMLWGTSAMVSGDAHPTFVETARSACFMCMFISVPIFYILHRDWNLDNTAAGLANVSLRDGGRQAFLSIVVEPACKFLAVCMLVLAARVNRVRDLVVPLSAVLAAHTLGMRRAEVPESSAIVASVQIALSVLAALGRALYR